MGSTGQAQGSMGPQGGGMYGGQHVGGVNPNFDSGHSLGLASNFQSQPTFRPQPQPTGFGTQTGNTGISDFLRQVGMFNGMQMQGMTAPGGNARGK